MGNMMDDPRASGQEYLSRTVGLCAHCAHVQVIVSDKGSRFYLCRMSFVDDRFPRYPPCRWSSAPAIRPVPISVDTLDPELFVLQNLWCGTIRAEPLVGGPSSAEVLALRVVCTELSRPV